MSSAIPDSLAIELWIEILSYLPRDFRKKMIGVCRALFDLALDDIYEEVVLCADDDKSRFAISQLQYVFLLSSTLRLVLNNLISINRNFRCSNISRRVRRLVVFLRPDNPRKRTLPIPQPHIGPANHSYRASISSPVNSAHGRDSYAQLLSIARHSLQSCCNIRDLKLVFSVSSLLPYFKSFLKSLWHPKSIGTRIRRLFIQASDTHLSSVFDLISVHGLSPPPLINIEELDLNFRRLLHQIGETRNYHHIVSFLSALEHSLVSFTASGYLLPHILAVFKASPTFSKLRKLELHSIFNVERDVQEILPLQQFISRHAETLEHVVIDPATREANSDLSSRLFLHWLSRNDAFSQQPLPNLRILELAYHHHWAYPYNRSSPSLFPNLNHISPNLTILSIKKIELNFDTVTDLLACVPMPNGVCPIESLELHIDILTPKLLDFLARNLPNLNSLEMFITCASENLENESPEQVCPILFISCCLDFVTNAPTVPFLQEDTRA